MGEHGNQRAAVTAGLLLGLTVRRGVSRVRGLLAVARLLGLGRLLSVLGRLPVLRGRRVARSGPGRLAVGGLAVLRRLGLPVLRRLLAVPLLTGVTGRRETGWLLSVGGPSTDLLPLVGLGRVRRLRSRGLPVLRLLPAVPGLTAGGLAVARLLGLGRLLSVLGRLPVLRGRRVARSGPGRLAVGGLAVLRRLGLPVLRRLLAVPLLTVAGLRGVGPLSLVGPGRVRRLRSGRLTVGGMGPRRLSVPGLSALVRLLSVLLLLVLPVVRLLPLVGVLRGGRIRRGLAHALPWLR
ncbi:hypothetical protein [Nocardiopsis quinghaiensis]|uniref:hypothetical protein n=1 Tax=Nocardiopsis quinghaiensis TaxID=464995 RepID=UPI0016812E6F|nr:hypothetical protein [Nocardiopsis quinghaiensis]